MIPRIQSCGGVPRLWVLSTTGCQQSGRREGESLAGAGDLRCSRDDGPLMPCEGLPVEPPPAPGVGSWMLGHENHRLERSTPGGIPGSALVFFLGDGDDVLALRLSEADPSLRATIPPTAVPNGATQIRVDGSRAFIAGTRGRLTCQQIVSLSRNHPEVDPLILLNVPEGPGIGAKGLERCVAGFCWALAEEDRARGAPCVAGSTSVCGEDLVEDGLGGMKLRTPFF